MTEALKGVIAPNLTPFETTGAIAEDLYIAHAKHLLASGCVGLAPFGTTGEALSVGIDERIGVLERMIGSGVDPARLIPGTGLTNVADTARLTAACLEMGCRGAMVLPPFYFKNVPNDGLYAHFARLIEAVGRDDLNLYLYHIPQVAGVGIPVEVVARLRSDFPDQIVGIKDSSGQWDNTRRLLTEIPGLIVYPGSELPLIEALELGAPGCISATANINGAAIGEVVRLYHAADTAGARAAHEPVKRFRLTVQDYAPIPAMKRLLALRSGDARWAEVRPPLLPTGEAKGRELEAALAAQATDAQAAE